MEEIIISSRILGFTFIVVALYFVYMGFKKYKESKEDSSEGEKGFYLDSVYTFFKWFDKTDIGYILVGFFRLLIVLFSTRATYYFAIAFFSLSGYFIDLIDLLFSYRGSGIIIFTLIFITLGVSRLIRMWKIE